jgi:DNA (cytosine-5)-methyltransferase 1
LAAQSTAVEALPAAAGASARRLAKLRRLRSGEAPRVVDLFAGCGGLSLGFRAAGYEIAAAVESDPLAAASHGVNFFKTPGERALHGKARDIVATDPLALLAELGLEPGDVTVVVGGPPCQAFARVGRAKLREVAEHPEAFLRDARSNLYIRYLQYVRELQPLALLMENVPDVLNFGGHNVAEEMCEVLEELGYLCRYTLLNASYYGVPQMRERMFLVGIAREVGAAPTFPAPTHWVELPRGYEGTRAVALRALTAKARGGANQRPLPFHEDRYYSEPPPSSRRLPPAVTARQAMADLPPITEHLEGKLRRGARRFDVVLPYPRARRLSDFARAMREWPGFENTAGVADHVIRFLPRDYKIFRELPAGAQYPEAHAVAVKMFERRLRALERRGGRPEPGTGEYERIWRETVPPYDAGKFPNKWRKMEADLPARTLMAHLGKDSYSHIHYDSEQARTISVREAARLQSFPDGFVFRGTMNPAFRQIGNAVPPVLAAALARGLLRTLKG